MTEPVENLKLSDATKLTYLEKKKVMEDLSDLRRLVMQKMSIGGIVDLLPPMIVERAVPSVKPVRPNKPLNIILSVVIGGFVGLLLAVLVYLLQHRAFQRKLGHDSAPLPLKFRWFLRVTTGLAVGVIIGYNCAMPMSVASLFFMLVFVLLGAIAFAFVELVKLTPTIISPGDPPQHHKDQKY